MRIETSGGGGRPIRFRGVRVSSNSGGSEKTWYLWAICAGFVTTLLIKSEQKQWLYRANHGPVKMTV
jgi:hypothetical protein